MKKLLVVSFFILSIFISACSNGAYADNRWWNNNYSYRKILTFNNSSRSENLTSFPALIKLSSSNFDFTKAQSSGADIRFIDSDNSTELPYEIEQWDSVNQTAAVWVKVPQIDASSNHDFIYMYYGNSATSDAQSGTLVWSNGYTGVWHMNQDPASSNVYDSTSNDYDAIASGTFTGALGDAKIGKGISFTTSNKLSNSSSAFKFAANQNFTVSIWSKEDVSNPKTWRPPIGTNSTISTRVGFWFLNTMNTTSSIFQIQNGTPTAVATSTSVNTIDGNWHHLVGVREGDTAYYYIDGELRGTATGANLDLTSSQNLTWAWTANNSPKVKFAGTLDETQISSTARSSHWISASYAAMTDNFVTYSDDKTTTVNISLSLRNELLGSTLGNYRMYGTVSSSDTQFIPSAVQYQINGGGWYNGTATDGEFDEREDEYYFDFSPKANNYNGNGFTTRLRTVRGTEVQADNLFYFSPFNPVKPENNSFVSTSQPTFTFAINKDRFSDLKDNLARFSVELNKNNSGWKTYIDSIPVNYELVKSSDANMKKTSATTNGNGVYEDKKIWVSYANNNSTIDVYAKEEVSKLSNGKYQWRIVAVDQRGHRQETDTRTFQIGDSQIIGSYAFFPLSVLSISGARNTNISTTQLSAIKASYATWATNPTLYGIAVTNANVNLDITDKECVLKNNSNCTLSYQTTTNPQSRWGINLPKNSLRYGKTYKLKLSVTLDNDYNELPEFDLKVASN